MILLLLILSVVGFFFAIGYVKVRRQQVLAIIASVAMLVFSTILVIGNMSYHWGMKSVTIEQRTGIYSVSQKNEVRFIIAEPIGTQGDSLAVVYKDDVKATKESVAKPDLRVTNKVERTQGAIAYKLVEKTKKVYRSNFAKFLFGIVGNDGIIKQTTNTFFVPKDWHVFTPMQAKKLQEHFEQIAHGEENGKDMEKVLEEIESIK